MTGALWAAAAGIGFGVFQSLNRRATAGIGSAYVSTFLQLLIGVAILSVACLATEDLSQLGDATTWGLIAFALAGIVHFLAGWTLLNLSQERIGASRTSPLLTMTPVFGLVIAALAYGEIPRWIGLMGMVVAVAGALLVTRGDEDFEVRPRDAALGLGCAFMWALSPIFTVEGLEGLESPLLGVTIGLIAAAVAYAIFLFASRTPIRFGTRDGVSFKLAAGTLVALATWARFIALDHTSVATTLTLNMLAVPVVLFLAPAIGGKQMERVTPKLWVGALLVMAGSFVLIVEG